LAGETEYNVEIKALVTLIGGGVAVNALVNTTIGNTA
jgi:hypothetical protein